MSNPPNEDSLMKRRYATLILRLLLDQQGQLVYGEIVDVANTHQEHFIGSSGLFSAVEAWLMQQEQNSAVDRP